MIWSMPGPRISQVAWTSWEAGRRLEDAMAGERCERCERCERGGRGNEGGQKRVGSQVSLSWSAKVR